VAAARYAFFELRLNAPLHVRDQAVAKTTVFTVLRIFPISFGKIMGIIHKF
jgi:hypothetical protein